MERPNILLITTDTQRCDTLACMGSSFARSPALDRLAARGVLFEQAHGSSPVCAPARCSLVTGVHTPIHGCIENGIDRRTDLPVFPDALAAAGYRNIMVGKTHFGPTPASFHAAHVLKGEKGADSDDFYAGHIRSHGYSRASGHPNPVPPELFVDAFLVDTTIREIEAAVKAGKGPFFAFCSMPSPHSPNDPPGEWAHLYDGATLPPLNYAEGEIERHPLHLRRLVGTLDREGSFDGPFGTVREAVGNTLDRADPALVDLYRRLYYGLAAYCDAQVGRLIDYLDAAGLRESTLVIFSSDHGLQLFDHGFNDKHNYFDESWRVPLILSQPGTLPQGARAGFAIWNDITATILAAAGAGDAMPGVQGFDLRAPRPRSCAVGTLYRSAALATRRWKLEYYYDQGQGRLYDRIADPRERNDLFGAASAREARDALLEALLAWRGDIADVEHLVRHTRGGGPVANRIASHTRAMRGADSERRLNERVARLDE